MDPAMIYGPYGLLVGMGVALVHLYRENTKLRDEAQQLLKEYRDRERAKLDLLEAEAAAERKKKADPDHPA